MTRRPIDLFHNPHHKGLERAAAAELKNAIWERSRGGEGGNNPSPPAEPRRPSQNIVGSPSAVHRNQGPLLPECFVRQVVAAQRLQCVQVEIALRREQLLLAVSTWQSNRRLYLLLVQLQYRVSLSRLRNYAKRRRAKIAAAVASNHWILSAEAAALVHLLENTQSDAFAAHALNKGTAVGLLRTIRSSLKAWRQHASNVGLSSRVHFSAAVMMMAQTVRTALMGWRQEAARAKTRYVAVATSEGRYKIRSLAGHMLLWVHYADCRTASRQTMLYGLQNMTHNITTRNFTYWREVATERRWRTFQSRQGLMNTVLRKAVRAIRGWLKAACRWRADKDTVQIVLLRMMNSNLSGAMQQWQNVVRGKVLALQLMSHAVLRLMNMSTCAALFTWRQVVGQSLRLRSLARSFILQIIHSRVVTTFHQWRAEASDSSQANAVARRVILRLIKGALFSSLQQWRLAAASNSVAIAVLMQMIHLKMTKSFRQWRTTAAAQIQSVVKARCVLLAIIRSTETRMWKCWRLGYLGRCRQMELLKPIAVRLLLSTQLAAMNCWRGNAAEAGSRRVVMMKAAGMLLSGLQARAWHSWRDWCRQRVTAYGALCMMANRALTAAWNQWRSAAAAQSRTKKCFREAAAIWWAASSIHLLHQWRQYSAKRSHVRASLRKVIQLGNNRHMRLQWRFWRQLLESTRQVQGVWQAVRCSMLKRVLWCRWISWTATSVKRVELIRFSLQRYILMQMGRCLRTWKEMIDGVAKARRSMRSALAAKMRRMFWEAFIAWYTFASDKMAMNAILKRTKMAVAGKKFDDMFAVKKQQKEASEWDTREQEGAARALKLWSQRQLAVALRQWLSVSKESSRSSNATRQAVALLYRRKLSDSFFGWFMAMLAWMENLAVSSRAAAFVKRSILTSGLIPIRQHAAWARSQKRKEKRKLLRGRNVVDTS